MYVVTSEQMRELDHDTICSVGIPAVALMENAGRAIAEEVIAWCRHRDLQDHGHGHLGHQGLHQQAPTLTSNNRMISADASLYLEDANREHWFIIIGKGNNGGDGLVAARHLHESGFKVTLIYADHPDRLQAEAAIQRDAATAMGLSPRIFGIDKVDFSDCTGIIDALLGTGSKGAPRAHYAELIHAANGSGKDIVAADIPSGLNVNTGELYDPCMRVVRTVCLAFLKRGLVQYPGAEAAGDIVVRSIGIPSDLCRKQGIATYLLTKEVLRDVLQVDITRSRTPDAHKGTFGHVLLAAGSLPMSGAGLLSARAVLRSGGALVTWALPGSVLPHMVGAAPEVMLAEAASTEWDEASARNVLKLASSRDVLAVGPGLGRFNGDSNWLRTLWEEATCPMVVDADALNMRAAATDVPFWKPRSASTVLTPHPGEMARLVGKSTKEIQNNRIEVAVNYAVLHGVTLVLKGARTVIATPDGNAYINTTGHAGMATGGAGDVLTGIIAGLLAQGLDGPQAAAFGVYLHGLAGESVASQRGNQASLIASDLIEAL